MEENKSYDSPLDKTMENTKEPPAVYSTMSALEIFDDTIPDPPEIWGGLQLAAGQIMEIIGPAGLGKSRLVLNLAINQILGRSFANMQVYDKPLTWLFYGNENSYSRYHSDLQKMFTIVSKENREKIGKYLFLPTLQEPADCYISFDDPGNRAKFKNTIIYRKADVVVMDPWGAVIAGDEVKDSDARATIGEIIKILHEAGKELNHPVVAIILNHALNNMKKFVEAAGLEMGDYGKNSKAIYSVVRTVWNLRRGSIDPSENKIEFIHAKFNDTIRRPFVCLELLPNSMTYEVDGTFRHAVYQKEIEHLYHANRLSFTDSDRQESQAEVDEDLKKKIVDYFDSFDNPTHKKDFDTWSKNTLHIGDEKRQELYDKLVGDGKLAQALERRAGGKKIVCTPEKMQKFLEEAPPEAYKKL